MPLTAMAQTEGKVSLPRSGRGSASASRWHRPSSPASRSARQGKESLVTGIANHKSNAWGIAQQLHTAGAELGVTYLPNQKGRFAGKVRELTAPLGPTLFEPLNIQD